MLIPAANVTEAVALATEMKKAGRYEWFRGQTRNWTLASSLVRKTDTREHQVTRVKKFFAWLRMTPGLDQLASNADQAIAVAQHYGLATNFIDFTTEPTVAGYFATEGVADRAAGRLDLEAEEHRFFSSQPATDEVGCILCLNRTKLRDVWDIKQGVRPVEPELAIDFLEITVPDLWRLEAQHGAFLYCPIRRFEEAVYDLDRIVFPHTGQVRSPTRAFIYPERKSHLEIQLEHYFQLERISEGMAALNEELRHVPINTVDFGDDDSEDPRDDRYFRTGSLPVHGSWTPQSLTGFISPQPESFWTALEPLHCELGLLGEPDPAESTASQLRRFFHDQPQCRGRSVTWTIASDADWRTEGDHAVTAIFDATRALPIADDEIIAAICNAMGLMALKHKDNNAPEGSHIFFGGQTIEIEIATHSKSYTRGWVTLKGLRSALRDDFAEHLTRTGIERYMDLEDMLLDIHSPRRLFELDRFTSLLLREFLPTQVVWRSDLPLVASPARVMSFGLP